MWEGEGLMNKLNEAVRAYMGLYLQGVGGIYNVIDQIDISKVQIGCFRVTTRSKPVTLKKKYDC